MVTVMGYNVDAAAEPYISVTVVVTRLIHDNSSTSSLTSVTREVVSVAVHYIYYKM